MEGKGKEKGKGGMGVKEGSEMGGKGRRGIVLTSLKPNCCSWSSATVLINEMYGNNGNNDLV